MNTQQTQQIAKIVNDYFVGRHGQNPKKVRKTDLKDWGLDFSGITLASAKEAIANEARRQNDIRTLREARRYMPKRDNVSVRAQKVRLLKKATQSDLQTQEKDRLYAIPKSDYPFGLAIVAGKEKVVEDFHYYSKGWHAKYGPKLNVTDRYVGLYYIDITGELKLVRCTRKPVQNGFRGNWLLSAIQQFTPLCAKKRWQKRRGYSLQKVQLMPQARVCETRRFGSIAIYRRTLAGLLVDHVAVRFSANGAVREAFHAATPSEALKGLRRKEESAGHRMPRTQLVTRKMLLHDLNFCKTGVEEAARILGLASREKVSVAEIADRARRKRDELAPFHDELKTLAKAVGCEHLFRKIAQEA